MLKETSLETNKFRWISDAHIPGVLLNLVNWTLVILVLFSMLGSANTYKVVGLPTTEEQIEAVEYEHQNEYVLQEVESGEKEYYHYRGPQNRAPELGDKLNFNKWHFDRIIWIGKYLNPILVKRPVFWLWFVGIAAFILDGWKIIQLFIEEDAIEKQNELAEKNRDKMADMTESEQREYIYNERIRKNGTGYQREDGGIE